MHSPSSLEPLSHFAALDVNLSSSPKFRGHGLPIIGLQQQPPGARADGAAHHAHAAVKHAHADPAVA